MPLSYDPRAGEQLELIEKPEPEADAEMKQGELVFKELEPPKQEDLFTHA